jgi:hypothetical protein
MATQFHLIAGSFGRIPRGANRFAHVAGLMLPDLAHGVDGLSQSPRLQSENKSLQEQYKQRPSRKRERYAVVEALVVSLFCFLFGSLGIIRGWERRDN